MWYLNFIPTNLLHIVIHVILVIGLVMSVIGFFVDRIPLIANYGIFIKVLGNTIFILAVFFEGGYGVEMSYRMKMQDLTDKIKVAEQKSEQTNIKLQQALKSKIVVIKERTNVISKKIESESASINADCKLNDTAWMLYNSAVTGKISGSSSGNVETSSGSKNTSSR